MDPRGIVGRARRRRAGGVRAMRKPTASPRTPSRRPADASTARLAAACALVFFAPAASTRADVVGPPPASCPAGSTPATGHSGPRCEPTPDCTTDVSCSATGRCVDAMQCIETRGCGGLMPPDSAPCTVEHVVGPCDGAGACSVGTCRARRVCTTDAVGRGSGCACRIGAPARRSAGAALAVLAVALTVAHRRSARSRSVPVFRPS